MLRSRLPEQANRVGVFPWLPKKFVESSPSSHRGDAAKKIAELIAAIQGDTDQALVAMDEGTREVKVGTKVVMEEIASSSHSLANLAQDLQTAVSHFRV